MKKIYSAPKLEIYKLCVEDVMTVSGDILIPDENGDVWSPLF